MGFRSHGIKRNTHMSWKHVRVLPQTNMFEAVITGFHSRRKPSLVARQCLSVRIAQKVDPHVYLSASGYATSRCLPRSGNSERQGSSSAGKCASHGCTPVPHLSYKAHSRHGATLNTQPAGNFPQSSCVLPSPLISTLGRSRSRPYSPPPPPSSTADVRHLPLSLESLPVKHRVGHCHGQWSDGKASH